MRKGDIIVAHQAAEGVQGLAYLDSDGHQSVPGGPYDTFDLKSSPMIWLRVPVPVHLIRQQPDSEDNIEFLKFAQGTVFRITTKGFEIVLQCILSLNGDQQERINRFLR
jgi:hypothetical protein